MLIETLAIKQGSWIQFVNATKDHKSLLGALQKDDDRVSINA
jgi:hypothetical protein